MEKKKETGNVKKIFRRFKSNLHAINDYFQNFGVIASDTDVNNIKKIRELVQQASKALKVASSKEFDLKVATSELNLLVKGMNETKKLTFKNFEILSRSSFLMLNNYFEYLLSDLLAYHYSKFQNSLSEKNFNIALKELSEYETLEEFTKSLITKEVESMMVEFSFKDLLDHFQTKLGVDNEKQIIDWDFITECRERRHLIVHNASVVSKKYLSRVKNSNGLKIGDQVSVTKEYFLKASNELYLAGLLMCLNCWGKWDKDETTDALDETLDETFELLKVGEFELVEKITNYCKKIEPRDDEQEDILLRVTFNRLIALKKLNHSSLQGELKKIKIGTASPIFRLAFDIISDNHKNIIELVKKAEAVDDLTIEKYHAWPIFEFIREIPDLNSKIEDELKPPIKVVKKSVPKTTKPPTKTKKIVKAEIDIDNQGK